MTNTLFYLYGILLPNGNWINELTDCTPATNTKHITGYASGQVVPDFRGGHGCAPDIRFTTPQLKTVLDACGLTGYDMSAGNCDLYYQAGVNLGTRQGIAETEHLQLRCVRALLYWESITARQGGDGDADAATIACRIIPTYDGVNPPFVPAGGEAIPSCALAEEYYGLGPTELNTVAVNGISSRTLELNPTLDEKASDGEDYLSWVSIRQHDPIETIETDSIGQWTNIGIDGLALTGIESWLRKKQQDNVMHHPDGNAVHIKFTGTAGLATVQQTAGADGNPANTTIRVAYRRPTCSSAHAMSVSTASAVA